MQSIDLIDICVYRTKKALVSLKEKIKCNNIIKRHKQWLIMICYKRKHKKCNTS